MLRKNNDDLYDGPSGPRTDAPLASLLGDDLEVPLVQGGWVRYVNLDYAASTQPLRAVARHLAEVTPYYSSVHRGAGYTSLISTAVYESARAAVARFLSVRADDRVVFTRNTTDSLNLLARCLPPDGEALVLDLEHHANLLPWVFRPHRILVAPATLADTLEALDRALAERSTALLAITGASNVTGEVVPLDTVAQMAHRHGARIVVDAAQFVPHRRIDLSATDVDYVVFSGHKMYAPYGAGVLAGRHDWLDTAPPYLAGGGAVHEARTNGADWATAPERHEAGSPNVLGAVALACACETLSGLVGKVSQDHETDLRNRLVDGLSRHRRVRLYRMWQDCTDAIGVVTFSIEGYEAGQVAAYLSAEHGIGVRDGRFCAHPLATRLSLPRSGAVRASFGLGSRMTDADRLIAAVDQLLGEGPLWRYERVAGRWEPVPDTRPLPSWMSSREAVHVSDLHALTTPCVEAAQ